MFTNILSRLILWWRLMNAVSVELRRLEFPRAVCAPCALLLVSTRHTPHWHHDDADTWDTGPGIAMGSLIYYKYRCCLFIFTIGETMILRRVSSHLIISCIRVSLEIPLPSLNGAQGIIISHRNQIDIMGSVSLLVRWLWAHEWHSRFCCRCNIRDQNL